MTKLNNDDFAKICIAVDRFREHLGRDEAINTINAIIAKRWTIAPSDDDAIISENARLRDLLDRAFRLMIRSVEKSDCQGRCHLSLNCINTEIRNFCSTRGNR